MHQANEERSIRRIAHLVAVSKFAKLRVQLHTMKKIFLTETKYTIIEHYIICNFIIDIFRAT